MFLHSSIEYVIISLLNVHFKYLSSGVLGIFLEGGVKVLSSYRSKVRIPNVANYIHPTED
jgi:hypothetical protein